MYLVAAFFLIYRSIFFLIYWTVKAPEDTHKRSEGEMSNSLFNIHTHTHNIDNVWDLYDISNTWGQVTIHAL